MRGPAAKGDDDARPAFSWIAWSPWLLSENGVGLLPYKPSPQAQALWAAAGILLGPTLLAFIMSGLTERRAGIRRQLGRQVLWWVGLRWYVFALIGIPAIFVLDAIAFSGDDAFLYRRTCQKLWRRGWEREAGVSTLLPYEGGIDRIDNPGKSTAVSVHLYSPQTEQLDGRDNDPSRDYVCDRRDA